MASANIDPRYIVDDGDLLLSWAGSLEFVMWAHGPGALNQHLFKVESETFPRWFYGGWIGQHLDSFRSIAAEKATTMGHIRRHHLTEAKVVVPRPEIVSVGDETLAHLVEQQLHTAVESRDLAAQRDSVLPRLLSGALRVGDLEPV